MINYVTAGEVARINYTSYKLCCKLCGCRSDGQNRLRESRKQPNFALEYAKENREFQFSTYGAIALDWASWLLNKLRNTLDRGRENVLINYITFVFQGRGKTTLLSALKGQKLPPNLSTVGIVIDEWQVQVASSSRFTLQRLLTQV